jgi:flavin-dependent dehydrogenase
MTKVSVVGGGNAGCITALYLSWYKKELEVELIYNPDVPCERVGQASVLDPPKLLWAATGFNWYNNPIHATFKSGILYEGWGQYNEKLFHGFPAHSMAMHYCPWEMQKHVLNSGHFKVTEGDVDPKDVDADYVFDCRGKPKDFSDYDDLINPTNAAILAKPNWDTTKAFWSRHVATPDGWTFIIPTHSESPSHDYCVGYCYNSDISSKEDAESNLSSMFDVEIKKHLKFKNYLAKNPIVDDRIFLNGNRLFFLEPLESSSVQAYVECARFFVDYIITKKESIEQAACSAKQYIRQLQNFVLWHYQFGSKYDTPFWDYATKLSFKDKTFDAMVEYCLQTSKRDILPKSYGGMTSELSQYGQWPANSFKVWYEGMTKREEK